MSKELTKEEAEEYYNKLWLENKELIQENIDKINTKIFALEMKLIDKDKEIERLTKQNKALNEMYELTKKEYIRLNNIINELEKCINQKIEQCYNEGSTIGEFNKICDIDEKLQELKGSE